MALPTSELFQILHVYVVKYLHSGNTTINYDGSSGNEGRACGEVVSSFSNFFGRADSSDRNASGKPRPDCFGIHSGAGDTQDRSFDIGRADAIDLNTFFAVFE